MFFGDNSICGEGLGFGVPALVYPNRIFFSTSANVIARKNEIIKNFSIDALQIKTWKDKIHIRNKVYFTIQRRFAEMYRNLTGIRYLLLLLMKLQSFLGIKLSYKRIESKGSVEARYRISKNKIIIIFNCSKIIDKTYRRLLIFNEQSSDFNLYRDASGILRERNIGAWEDVKFKRACLTNEKLKVTFCVENIPGTKLHRGWECMKPRLDWAGFCHSIPSNRENFIYEVQVEG